MADKFMFVLGSPGAGKGTLCTRLAEAHGLRHLSVGDMLRHYISLPDTDKAIVDHVKSGKLMSPELLVPILRLYMGGEEAEGKGRRLLLLDAFPRSMIQLRPFEEAFGDPLLVLQFECPKELAEERVVNRRAGRAGDDRETFRKRYTEYTELNPEIVSYYEGKGTLVKIDTSRGIDASYAKLLDALEARREWQPWTHQPPLGHLSK